MYFLDGTNHYRSQKWPDVINRMERALEGYLEADVHCRFSCEKPFDMGWYPDFITSIASMIAIAYLTFSL